MAQCNVQSLMDEAACFACLPAGLQQAIELSLLCEILAINTSPTNLQEVFVGHYNNTPPVFVPPQNRGVAYDLDAPFQTFKWNPDTQAWE